MKSLTHLARCGLRLAAVSVLAGSVFHVLAGARPPNDPLQFHLTVLGTYTNGAPFEKAAAKVVTHDPVTQRLFVANERDNRVDVLSIADPAKPVQLDSIPMAPYGAVVNGVSVCGGLLAVAVQANPKTDPGRAVFFDSDLKCVADLPVGAMPDFITFSPDGRWVVVANEGEPNTYNDFGAETNGPSIDPEGSVTIIDLVKREARTATFTAFNDATLDPSIRIYGPNATVAQDLEPESIAISPDSRTAFVTLQENNALALIDLESATVTGLIGLGFKDHSLPGNGFDASDQDNKINIANWPVWGIYMPDEVAAYHFQGETYLVMANEGDTRDYPGFSEEARGNKLKLDTSVFPNAATLSASNNLGRLNFSKVGSDPDKDGKVELLFVPGGRSFSIRTTSGELVFDSGDQFEQSIATLYPGYFNADNTGIKADNRSDNKGPEPEGVVLGKVAGRVLAFIGLERIGGIMVYDVSDPFQPHLVDYVNNRTFADSSDLAVAGDLGPEGLKFIGADESPNGKPMLAVASEISGTVTLFQINVSGPGRTKHLVSAD